MIAKRGSDLCFSKHGNDRGELTKDEIVGAEKRSRTNFLRLVFAAESLGDLVSQSVKEDWNATAFLDALLRLELERQEERRVTQAIRISHLPTGPTLANFDFAYQPSVSRSQIDTLATCSWIREAHGLLLQGPPGVGKTHYQNNQEHPRRLKPERFEWDVSNG